MSAIPTSLDVEVAPVVQPPSPITEEWLSTRPSTPSSPAMFPSSDENDKTKPTSDGGDNSDSLKPVTEQCDRYLLDFQLWDMEKHAWMPYDPSTYVPPPSAIRDGKNYFHVKVQYMDPADKPTYRICQLSETLLLFLRGFIGNNFFNPDPEEDVKTLFPYVQDLLEKPAEVKRALERLDEDLDEARSLAIDLGYLEAGDAKLPEGPIRAFLVELEEHLAVLLEYVGGHFKPVEEKLERLKAYGHIEFSLLPYFFNVGDHIATQDSGNDICFVVESRMVQPTCWGPGMEFVVSGYGYEWGGSDYVRYPVSRTIPSFKGTQETATLLFKHLTDDLKAKLRERGKLYAALSGTHYRTYRGERVIIDRLAYNNPEGYSADPDTVPAKLWDENFHLAPAEVKGFNLVRKTWASFEVNRLEPVVFDEQAWDHLVLDPDTKTLIQALVKVTQNANTSSKIMSDVISGKGGGLIAVLHGPPGTGKTLTAEGVAELLRRPLYMVGASELSTEPATLETNLKGILSLATAWDAVLLIDEADVFLERRSLHEIQRNALVSVALRVLEYHRGVLFLTTNRIKTFDEAFLSRFSIAIKYPELDQAGRASVWKKFLALAGCRLVQAVDEVEDNCISAAQVGALAVKPFNGRTIKNIVRTAQALAMSTNEPLRLPHVQIVIRAQEKFLDEFASTGRE